MVVFVILHYKVFEETKQCVDSIINNVNGEKKIIVVDNSSQNGSGEKIENEYKNVESVKVIYTKKNLGFACGNNYGYEYALKEYNPKYIVVMNNDMEILQNNFIELIDQSYKENKFDIMGPDVYSTKACIHQNPEKNLNYDIKKLTKIKKQIEIKLKFRFLFRLKYLIEKNKNNIYTSKNKNDREIELKKVMINVPLHGSFYVFSEGFMKTHKECFYNKTFMYMESQILFYQAMRDGMKMIYDPRMQVLHHEDVSTNSEYKGRYDKAIFTNECLLKSCNAYIELLEEDLKNKEI